MANNTKKDVQPKVEETKVEEPKVEETKVVNNKKEDNKTLKTIGGFIVL